MVGVEYLIRGTVTEYAYRAKDTGLGAGYMGVNVGVKKQDAVVGIDVRIIDASTGAILASKHAERKNSGKGFSGGVGIAGAHFGGESWAKTPIGRTTRECIQDCAEQALSAIAEATWRTVVLNIDNSGIMIRGGIDQGLKPGMVFAILRKGKEIDDPETGEKVAVKAAPVGKIIIISVNDKISIAQQYEGGTPVRGDWVTLP
jgi:hypothetical protein